MTAETLSHLAASLKAAAPAIANHLWQSTVFAAVVGLLTLALRSNQARARHWLWMAASLKFLLPFALFAGLAAHFAKPRVAPAQTTAVYSTVEDFSEPFTVPAPPVLAVQPKLSVPVLPLLCVAIWLAGFVTLLGFWILCWLRIARGMRRAVLLAEGREVEALRRIEAAAGVRRAIRLRVSSGTMEPGVFGMVRPMLAWPAGLSDRLDDAHLEAILAHEVCHVRRRDNLASALHMLVEAAFWFYPLVWWLGARLLAERERACDEEVLLLLARPREYAESILKVCEYCVETPLACVSGVTGADLKQRVRQIMSARAIHRLTWTKKLLLLASAAAIAWVPLALAQAHATQRLAFAALKSAPAPIRTFAHALIPIIETPSTQELAAVQADAVPATDPGPSFEVATIRPSQPSPYLMRWQPTPDGLIAQTMTLQTLISYAYGMKPGTIFGATGWMSQDQFDINAKFSADEIHTLAAHPEEMKDAQISALRNLLRQRFGLNIEEEMQDVPAYTLVVAKGGPKLTPASAEEIGQMDGGGGSTVMPDGHRIFKNYSTNSLARDLSNIPGVERPVLDETGLKGTYDFDFTWKPTPDDSGPSLFTVMQEQLGLKLVPKRVPMKTLIIQSTEKPSVDGAEVRVPTLPPAAPVHQEALPDPSQSGAEANASFEVATIKPSMPDESRSMQFSAARYAATHVSVRDLMRFAYDVRSDAQLAGEPDWSRNEYYDIEGKASAQGIALMKQRGVQWMMDQNRLMLRSLLRDRFQLKLSKVSEQLPVYALVVGKGGPKMKQVGIASTTEMAGPIPPPPPPPPPSSDPSHPMLRRPTVFPGMQRTGLNQFAATAVSMNWLARFLQNQSELAGRPVIDETGLTGVYDFTLHNVPMPGASISTAEPASPDTSVASIFSVVEEIGLKLVATKAPVEVIAIDHIEKPTPN